MNVHDLMARMAGRKKARDAPLVAPSPDAGPEPALPSLPSGNAVLDRAFARLERRKAAHARAQALLATRGRGDEGDEEWARAMKRLGRR